MSSPFFALHDRDEPFLLPNAWDVPSALAFADAGFPAIGTTSFGVACALGRPDGGRATRDANLDLARRLARLPVLISVDIEDGYADAPHEVAAYAERLAGLGVAGINIEDSTDERLVAPERHAAKIAAVKAVAPGLFVNARVDNYWLGADATVPAVLARAAAYAEAGCDGIFVPGATDPGDLRELASRITVPVNFLVVPGLTLAALGELGARRISTGSLPYRAALHSAVEVATAVREGHTDLPAGASYAGLQSRLAAYDRLAP